MAINFAQNTNIVADNKVTFCGLEYFITDDEAKKLKVIMDSMISARNKTTTNNSTTTTTTTPSNQMNATSKPTKTYKYAYSKKDLQPAYSIDKQTSSDGKTYFCISRGKSGWTTAEKAVINNHIKSLEKIITIDVPYVDKNGKNRTFTAWGYKTKKEAMSKMLDLPTTIFATDINKYVDELNDKLSK